MNSYTTCCVLFGIFLSLIVLTSAKPINCDSRCADFDSGCDFDGAPGCCGFGPVPVSPPISFAPVPHPVPIRIPSPCPPPPVTIPNMIVALMPPNQNKVLRPPPIVRPPPVMLPIPQPYPLPIRECGGDCGFGGYVGGGCGLGCGC